jgi:hypothetical protein
VGLRQVCSYERIFERPENKVWTGTSAQKKTSMVEVKFILSTREESSGVTRWGLEGAQPPLQMFEPLETFETAVI